MNTESLSSTEIITDRQAAVTSTPTSPQQSDDLRRILNSLKEAYEKTYVLGVNSFTPSSYVMKILSLIKNPQYFWQSEIKNVTLFESLFGISILTLIASIAPAFTYQSATLPLSSSISAVISSVVTAVVMLGLIRFLKLEDQRFQDLVKSAAMIQAATWPIAMFTGLPIGAGQFLTLVSLGAQLLTLFLYWHFMISYLKATRDQAINVIVLLAIIGLAVTLFSVLSIGLANHFASITTMLR